jgi:hypothetical protein
MSQVTISLPERLALALRDILDHAADEEWLRESTPGGIAMTEAADQVLAQMRCLDHLPSPTKVEEAGE